ncbi:hypothetical protein WG906_18565 [Pedobacter sp. P351]|uniref:hypothetical protein n=1 Tax=Pedobacter superstes TaxID=3133441 RepID=UPI0030955136
MIKAVLTVFCLVVLMVNSQAQTSEPYVAPQDTVKIKRSPGESITSYKTITQPGSPNSHILGIAVKVASMLKDTTKYDQKKGILVETLIEKTDLEYLASQGVNTIVALFELVNKHLPDDQTITFRTEEQQNVKIAENPLVLKDLRAMVASKPATIHDPQQWKENVYHAYMARDYGTKLHNTITITSATREIRETPGLEIINFDGRTITLAEILKKHQAGTSNKYEAEKAAVAEFRALTFPSSRISKANANENYKRALFELIRLQEGDIRQHPLTRKLVEDLTNDLKKGKESNVINSLKNNPFFDANVPGNLGPVLLTEDQVISPEEVRNNAEAKAMELIMLTALHYGERDAVKLFRQLINGNGSAPAKQTGDFTPKRLAELTDHGTEKLKSLGYGPDKTRDMSSSDLVLVAVSAPETPVEITPTAFITTQMVGVSIFNQYSTVETKNIVMFSPRITLASRHTQYRAAFDPVEYIPEIVNGEEINQRGSKISQNGVEMRIESDLYFSNPQRIIDKGVKPGIFPQFGVIAGVGRRKVGYDNSTTLGQHGAVPQFKSIYVNWGGHFGLNGGPFLLAADATYLSSQSGETPNEQFFDISQGMTLYRFSFLTHIFNFGLGKTDQGNGTNLTLDLDMAGETNNTGFRNRTITPGSTSQTGNREWRRDYDRAHPGGTYNHAIATNMILNGDVKATYAASSSAALQFGIQKSALHLKGALGLYNLYTVDQNNLVNKDLFKNTIEGNLFGRIGLTYTFGSRSFTEKHTKKESYQTTSKGESPHKIEESSSSQKSSFIPRDHAIFTNKKSRAKQVEETKP